VVMGTVLNFVPSASLRLVRDDARRWFDLSKIPGFGNRGGREETPVAEDEAQVPVAVAAHAEGEERRPWVQPKPANGNGFERPSARNGNGRQNGGASSNGNGHKPDIGQGPGRDRG
jgi:hypothetical protein